MTAWKERKNWIRLNHTKSEREGKTTYLVLHTKFIVGVGMSVGVGVSLTL